MSLDICKHAPCPLLKSCGKGLPQQPRRCYNCEKRRVEGTPSTASSSRSSCSGSVSSQEETLNHTTSLTSPLPTPSMPKVCVKSLKAGEYSMRPTLQCYGGGSYQKTFSFTCKHDHAPPPHYDSLPAFLPHQNHDCPCCQFDAVRVKSDTDITSDAVSSWPMVRDDRVKSGRPEWEWDESRGALDRYIEERRQEEREMLFMVTRKWEQDLRGMRVMCDGEGGCSLMG